LHKLPCRNGGKVEDDLDDWVKDFDPEYIRPLIQYMDAIASIKFGLPSKEARKVLAKSSIQKKYASKCRIKVSGISKKSRNENKNHPLRVGDGVYFYFDRRQLDMMMGHKNWKGMMGIALKAVNVGAAEEMEVRIWRGDEVKDPFYASGRKADTKAIKAEDWSVGDEIEFKDCVDGKWEMKMVKECGERGSVDVLSVDHGSGGEGKYFNFDKEELDAILGRTDWSGERLAVSNGKQVVVWRNANGASKGDAHGRWDEKAKENQWSIGDKVKFC